VQLSVFVVGTANYYNFMDGMDGIGYYGHCGIRASWALPGHYGRSFFPENTGYKYLTGMRRFSAVQYAWGQGVHG